MFYDFSINNMTTSLKNKEVTISYTLDIDKNRTNDILVEVFERETKSPLMFEKIINRNTLTIKLRDWPIPNTEYILGIKGVRSITGEELSKNLKTKFCFKSEITSKVDILKPSLFEIVKSPYIELREVKRSESEEELLNCFYLEVALDNSFIDIPYKTFLEDKNSIIIALNKYGQYFLRARVQKTVSEDEIMYGEWSDTITFVYGSEEEEGGLPPLLDPDDPVIEPDLEPEVIEDKFEIIVSPDIGEKLESFVFEFNQSLNDLMIEDLIMITRKDVK